MAEKLSKLLSRQTPRWGQDKTYPTMWRVRLLDGSGSLSDMVNRTRVKDVRRCAVEARHAVLAATHEAAPHSVEQRSKRPTAWLGMKDSNSETSPQIISLKGRTDFRESSRILALETIRVRAAALGCAACAKCRLSICRS
jgi:hypothetical protein